MTPRGVSPAPEDPAALAVLEGHWAVRAVEPEVRARAVAAVERWWSETTTAPLALDDDLLHAVGTLATAYELSALEHLEALTRPPLPGAPPHAGRLGALRAGAARALHLYGVLPPDPAASATSAGFHLLHVAALAVVGDREEAFARWRARWNGAALGALPDDAAAPWDRVLLDRTARLWIELLSPDRTPESLARVRAQLASIREDREPGEQALGRSMRGEHAASVRYHLFSLYHLVDAAAALTTYLAHGEPAAVLARLHHHVALARAATVGDARREIAIAWLHGAAAILALRRTEQLTLPGLAR